MIHTYFFNLNFTKQDFVVHIMALAYYIFSHIQYILYIEDYQHIILLLNLSTYISLYKQGAFKYLIRLF